MPDAGEDRTLETNLARLEAGNPGLARRIRSARPDPRFVRAASRSGTIVPVVRSPAGDAPLHSLYDPHQESRRLAEAARGNGFLAFCGLGGGFHVEAALEDRQTLGVLVIEKDEAVLRGLLGQFRYGRLLDDPRVSMAIGLAEIRPAVLRAWKPALMGGMKLVPLRSWCDQEKQFFDAAAAEVQDSIQAVRADYSVQSHFGKRWFTNILLNLPRVTPVPVPRRAASAAGMPPAVAAVTAAGPSLEHHLADLSSRRRTLTIVATDTSLPALLRSGLQPDVVLSIDCQAYGYHHFLQGLPPRTSLYLDLASPPFLARRFPAARFVASGHPFARYLDARWMRLPLIDTSGGNVAHAAVSLARALGAGRIEVYGADFSYPSGKPYARGTYLYDFFQAEQDRFTPADSALLSFALANGTLEKREGKSVYATAVLTAYRQRFEELMAAVDARTFEWPPPPRNPAGWKEMLSDFAGRLRSLPAPARIAGMDELWGTMLPAAARAVKEGFTPGVQAIEEARRWSLERIRRALTLGEK